MSHPTLQQTIINIMDFHSGQVDKSQVSYFNHPIRVMVRLGPDATDTERHAALLHDVIEDTPITMDILADLGYSNEVLDIVNLLTRRDAETHRGYIYRIIRSENISAVRVKLADLYDNANKTRAMQCEDEEVRKTLLEMIESRYKPAIRILKDIFKKDVEGVIDGDLKVDILEDING